jgi:hypothetical protein
MLAETVLIGKRQNLREWDGAAQLGLAHALQKPVVLISSNEEDVPFDVRHVRVIYYDVNDPFWGEKLIAKVAENVASALANPSDAIQFKD